MAGGRTEYTLTNARRNEILPGFKELTPKDLAYHLQSLTFDRMDHATMNYYIIMIGLLSQKKKQGTEYNQAA